MLKYKFLLSLIFLCFNFNSSTVLADNLAEATCPDAGIWSSIIDKVCWSGVFPIYWAGIEIDPDGGGRPPGANDVPVCTCDVGGVPVPGMSVGMFQPARMATVVRQPYCMPEFGGEVWVDSISLGSGKTTEREASDKIFYHNHYISFPLFQMFEFLTESYCALDGYTNFDVISMSEYDPTYVDDMLALWINQEAIIFANPAAIAACGIDAIQATSGYSSVDMYWCAGAWGHLYPFTGNISSEASPPRDTSLIVARNLAKRHRMGQSKMSIGRDAMCGGEYTAFIPKVQYQLQQFYPLSESDPAISPSNSCTHSIGAHTFTWGEFRNIPAVGEDFLHLILQYSDCCMRTL
jgi:conjugal transfer pilus assembly protein TraU